MFRCLTEVGAGPKTSQPSPARNQAYRRSSHSEGTEVRTGLCGRLKSRTHARVEAERQRFVGPRPLEARSLSTAVPKRCRGARLLGVGAAEAAASTSGISVTRRELDPPKWGEETLSS